jgi:acetyl-CoA carboxylase biotin carboxyl carrier protein
MMFKDVDLKQLFGLMQEYDIAETTLKDGKAEVVVRRTKEPIVMTAGSVIERTGAPAQVPAPGAGESQLQPGGQEALPQDKPAEAAGDNFYQVTSPIVGTFYRASSPDADPFVQVGDRVNAGDVVCIVEAMKSMNEIQVDVSGVIKEICVENAEMVEFEQALFKIDTSA